MDECPTIAARELAVAARAASEKATADAMAAKGKADAAAAAAAAKEKSAAETRAKLAKTAVRVGGAIPSPKKIKDVAPVYPAIAKSNRIGGTVEVELTVGPDGKVVATRVLKSVPVLNQAALDAVEQWEVRADPGERGGGAGHPQRGDQFQAVARRGG